jgi:hypothetical protein
MWKSIEMQSGTFEMLRRFDAYCTNDAHEQNTALMLPDRRKIFLQHIDKGREIA